jgi:hypothetical protein
MLGSNRGEGTIRISPTEYVGKWMMRASRGSVEVVYKVLACDEDRSWLKVLESTPIPTESGWKRKFCVGIEPDTILAGSVEITEEEANLYLDHGKSVLAHGKTGVLHLGGKTFHGRVAYADVSIIILNPYDCDDRQVNDDLVAYVGSHPWTFVPDAPQPNKEK